MNICVSLVLVYVYVWVYDEEQLAIKRRWSRLQRMSEYEHRCGYQYEHTYEYTCRHSDPSRGIGAVCRECMSIRISMSTRTCVSAAL